MLIKMGYDMSLYPNERGEWYQANEKIRFQSIKVITGWGLNNHLRTKAYMESKEGQHLPRCGCGLLIITSGGKDAPSSLSECVTILRPKGKGAP